jgi:subtilisin family serine protease
MPDDPLISNQWGLTVVNVMDVWKRGIFGASSIKVCVIDTGIDLKHPDLQQNLWTNPDEIDGNGLDDDENGIVDDIHGVSFESGSAGTDIQDLNGHGTFVAGVIGATTNNGIGVSGVSQLVNFVICKFMNSQGLGDISNAIKCIDYCLSRNVDIIHSSWGYYNFISAMETVLNKVRLNKVYMISSSGNNGENSDSISHYPSFYSITNDHVISVTALTKDLKLLYSANYGNSSVQLAAPGQSIMSTSLGGLYSSFSGTSAAAPFVTGAVVLLKSLNKYSDVKNILLQSSTSRKINNIQGGILDVKKAIDTEIIKKTAAIQFSVIYFVIGVLLGSALELVVIFVYLRLKKK